MTTGNTLDAPALNGISGAVELREDAPLKRVVGRGRGGAAWCGGGSGAGSRLVLGAFGALSACITVALVAQIYSGDFELVPHGVVASGAAACSRAGTDALKAGGRAIDAAAAAALCLAVVAPHRTALDASGSLLYWEYRESRTQAPTLYEWGGPGAADAAGGEGRAPRLLAALAHLHATLGALPWARVLLPAVHLATQGFPVSDGLAGAARGAGSAGGALQTGANLTSPELAIYLGSFLSNTSAELSAAWGGSALVRASSAARVSAGEWRVVAGGAGGAAATRALTAALDPPPATPAAAQQRVVAALQREALASARAAPAGVATGLAVVDRHDTYVALVTGLSAPFGSGPATAAGWLRDEPLVPLDVAPAFIIDSHVCGSRYVLGAESWAALAQAGAALVTAPMGAPSAVEGARVALAPGGALLREERPAPGPTGAPPALRLARNASLPYAAVNVVLQRGDALSSHADSRGGGLASRF